MKWITRERPKIDRIACSWLIERFIDKQAEFLYVPAAEVMRRSVATGSIPYDISGIEPSHEGELCGFDAFLKKYQLTDPALQQLARHRAWGVYLPPRPDTAIGRPVRGLLRSVAQLPDDHEMHKHGLMSYGTLHLVPDVSGGCSQMVAYNVTTLSTVDAFKEDIPC